MKSTKAVPPEQRVLAFRLVRNSEAGRSFVMLAKPFETGPPDQTHMDVTLVAIKACPTTSDCGGSAWHAGTP